jgi:cobalt-zinc-cadmium efflux system protein
MLTDIMALVLALMAMIFSSRPANARRTYGFYRLEILSALVNGLLLGGISLYLFYEAYVRSVSPVPIKSGLMLWVAVIGLIANIACAAILVKGSKSNMNVRGAFLHMVSDAISSVGVIAAALIIHYTGIYIVDPLLGCLIGLLILRGAVTLVFDAVNVLLEATPKDINLVHLVADIKNVKGIIGIHDLHVWALTSGINAISAHLTITDSQVENSPEILGEIRKMLEQKYKIKHCTFQTECKSCPEGIICKIEPPEQHGTCH